MLDILDEPPRHGGGHTARVEARLSGQQGEDLVRRVVERPEVGGPVGVAQSSLEGKQPSQDMAQVVCRDKCQSSVLLVKSNLLTCQEERSHGQTNIQ